jgi:hypothetical protein
MGVLPVFTRLCWHATPFSADTSLAILKTLSIALVLTGLSIADAVAAAPDRPNILLIVADDLGYSDVGAFGGEIQTGRKTITVTMAHSPRRPVLKVCAGMC